MDFIMEHGANEGDLEADEVTAVWYTSRTVQLKLT